MRVGEQAKILTPSSWNKAFSVFGAMNTVSGELFWEIFDRKNSDCFIIFLERLLSAHPNKIIYFVVDRASYHTSKKVKEWLSNGLSSTTKSAIESRGTSLEVVEKGSCSKQDLQ